LATPGYRTDKEAALVHLPTPSQNLRNLNLAVTFGSVISSVRNESPEKAREREEAKKQAEEKRHEQELIRIMWQVDPEKAAQLQQIENLKDATEQLKKENERHENAKHH
jgi:hypothetical protein